MTEEPKIPFGFVRIFGQAQKGDGVWDYAARKFRKARKEYPWGAAMKERIIIRRATVTQPEITGVGRTGLDLDEE